MSVPTLPENAPFEPSQRAWLNGFFAGLYTSSDGAANFPVAPSSNGATNGAANGVAAMPAPVVEAPTDLAEDDDFPWHDPALPLDERMELADGKPLPRRLMAAMAQLDCGQCGYLCQSYAEAIADGSEKSLTRCVPGAKETSKKLKEIMAA